MASASAQPQARRERHPHYLLKFCLAPQLGTPLRTRLTFACPIQVWRVHVFMYCSPNSPSEANPRSSPNKADAPLSAMEETPSSIMDALLYVTHITERTHPLTLAPAHTYWSIARHPIWPA